MSSPLRLDLPTVGSPPKHGDRTPRSATRKSKTKDRSKSSKSSKKDGRKRSAGDAPSGPSEFTTMLFLACAARGEMKKCGELLSSPPPDGERPLHVDACDYDQRRALHVAAAEGHVDVVSFLLAEGANPNAKDRWGKTPLDDALFFGHDSVIMILRAHGASLGDASDGLGAKLCEAAKQNNVGLIKRLALCGVNVNQSDYDARTPLHIAAAEGNIDATKVLLLLGSEPLLTDRWGSTPLADAQKAGHADVANFLSYYSGDHRTPPPQQAPLSPRRTPSRYLSSANVSRHHHPSLSSKRKGVSSSALPEISTLSLADQSPLSSSASPSLLSSSSSSSSVVVSLSLTTPTPSPALSPPATPTTAEQPRARSPTSLTRVASSKRARSPTAPAKPAGDDLKQTAASESSRCDAAASSSPSLEPVDSSPRAGRVSSSNDDSSVDLDYGDLVVEQEISHGSFGVVFRGKWRGQEVAIKEIRSGPADDQQQKIMILQLRREIASLNRIQHPNVVRFIGACFVPPKVALVTEFVRGDTLLGYLKNYAKTPRERDELMSHAIAVGLQIAKGMAHAHSLQIVHRDLKSPNIMVEEGTGRVVIIDFGSARVLLSTDLHMTKGVGSFRWIAPELFLSSQYNEKVDVYSFGVILWEMLHPGQIPLAHYTPIEAAYATSLRKVRPAVSLPLSSAFAKLLRACWHQEPKNRPAFTALVDAFETQTASLMKPPKTGLKRLLS